MRKIVCDMCGCSIVLNPRETERPRSIVGTVPDDWAVLWVSKLIKPEEIVDLCPFCKEKFDSVRDGAQKTMDATIDAWIKMSLDDKKETRDGD